MKHLQVGKLYNTTKNRWDEGAQYNYRCGQHELVLFFDAPTSREVEAVKRGRAAFALIAEPPLILLCYRFGEGIPWSDAPYSYHLVAESERSLPDLIEDGSTTRAFVLVLLVDAKTGVLLVIRQLSFSNEFTVHLHHAIREQALYPWDTAGYDRALSDLYSRRSTEDRVSGFAHRPHHGSYHRILH